MSASLVGSEMCIRDRFWARQPCWCSDPCTSTESQKPGLGPLAGEGAVAVSYTHLTLPTICSV
eukprot:11435752-Alexandrium_andersonii.AAC.1